ncbi:hypothetical protein [Methylobacterium oxalidis]|uniref:hypothetical protein n=1 Tax=Methylobacterium oxalidis TaxID=944322 RepID=UPI003315C45A
MQKPQRHLDPERIAELTPRGGLQAAEFEDRKLGRLSAVSSSVIYTDAASGAVLLSNRFASRAEAVSQLNFYRSTFQDVKARRRAFRVV